MKHRIEICMGSSCFARGNERNLEIIEDFLKKRGMEATIDLRGSLCAGQCSKGPNIAINEKMYHGIDSGTLIDLLKSHFEEKVRS